MIELPPPVSSDGSVSNDAHSPDLMVDVPREEVPERSAFSNVAPAVTANVTIESSKPTPLEAGAGRLPPPVIEFLQQHASVQTTSEGQEWLQTTKQKLRVALRNYGLDAEVIGERLTPNAALVRFKGSDKPTVADVEKKQGVLLTSHGLDVISVQPERGEVTVRASVPSSIRSLEPSRLPGNCSPGEHELPDWRA